MGDVIVLAAELTKGVNAATVTSIDLSGNNIGIRDVFSRQVDRTSKPKSWCRAARQRRRSNVLMMRDGATEEGSEGLMQLAAVLSTKRGLVKCNLSNCRLQPIGLKAMVHAGLFRGTLEDLDISRNEIGDEGMAILARGRITDCGLRSLNIRRNNFGWAGKIAFGNMLRERNTRIQMNFQSDF